MMDYEYDVFLSVKSGGIYEAWLTEHFLPLFESYLKEDVIAECGSWSGYFYYRENIGTGEQWKESLKKGIKASRCVVALCSPSYFKADYCLLEWMSFSERARLTNKDLIIPVAIHDGDSFPLYAQDIQSDDLGDFVIEGEGFKKTELYPDFQKKLKALSRKVAKKVKDAPKFKNWDIAPNDLLSPSDDADISQRTLE